MKTDLIRQLAFENVNKDCQVILCPIKERDAMMEYLKSCLNVGSIKCQSQIHAIKTYSVWIGMDRAIFPENTVPSQIPPMVVVNWSKEC